MTSARLSLALLAAGLFALASSAAPAFAPPSVPQFAPVRADPPKADEADQILLDLVTGPVLLNGGRR